MFLLFNVFTALEGALTHVDFIHILNHTANEFGNYFDQVTYIFVP